MTVSFDYSKVLSLINNYQIKIQNKFPDQNSPALKRINEIFDTLRSEIDADSVAPQKRYLIRLWNQLIGKSEKTVCLDKIQQAMLKEMGCINDDHQRTEIEAELRIEPIKISLKERLAKLNFANERVIGIRNRVLHDYTILLEQPLVISKEVLKQNRESLRKTIKASVCDKLKDVKECTFEKFIDGYVKFIEDRYTKTNSRIRDDVSCLLASSNIKHTLKHAIIKRTTKDSDYTNLISNYVFYVKENQLMQSLYIDFKDYLLSHAYSIHEKRELVQITDSKEIYDLKNRILDFITTVHFLRTFENQSGPVSQPLPPAIIAGNVQDAPVPLA